MKKQEIPLTSLFQEATLFPASSLQLRFFVPLMKMKSFQTGSIWRVSTIVNPDYGQDLSLVSGSFSDHDPTHLELHLVYDRLEAHEEMGLIKNLLPNPGKQQTRYSA